MPVESAAVPQKREDAAKPHGSTVAQGSPDRAQERSSRQGEPMFNLSDADFRYEPYPIGLIRPLMADDLYRELVDSYPSRDLFVHLPKVGHKFTLSEKFNADNYHRFIAETPVWKRLHDWMKSEDFIRSVDAMLRDNFIDLGLVKSAFNTGKNWRRVWKDLARARFPRVPSPLQARFEFSMLPADGGYILPHTDTPKKIITLIVSILNEGEWDPAVGGGTEVNRPKDCRHAYNWLNEYVPFDEVQTLDTFEFAPNQCVIFVKTFNSLHCVRPMKGEGLDAMRKTLTINVERGE